MKKFKLKQARRIISSKTKHTPFRILKACCNELRRLWKRVKNQDP